MMTAARALLPLELDATSERELDKLKQKVERLGKLLRIRILCGSPEEEVGAWSDRCLLHEESFTDKRHNTIKNKITDALQLSWFQQTVVSPLPKEGEIQGQIRQHSRLINTLGVRQTRISVNRIECGAAGCAQEKYFETEDHRNETGSSGEPSSELLASTCSTSLTQW